MADEGTGTGAPRGGQSASTAKTPNKPRGKRPRKMPKDQLLAEGWMTPDAEDLKTLVNQLWNELGGSLTPIWKELNQRRILTSGSAIWSYQNLRRYLEMNPDVKKKHRANPKPVKEAKPKKTETGIPPSEEPVRETVQLDSRAPMWRADLKSGKASVYAKQELLDRAEEKAKREKLKSGGNLSNLVAVLLWHYVGCPQDLIEIE
ncbi:MAG: hypothetical protein WBG50_28670 [Desulfomonilaceae bacterium]